MTLLCGKLWIDTHSDTYTIPVFSLTVIIFRNDFFVLFKLRK